MLIDAFITCVHSGDLIAIETVIRQPEKPESISIAALSTFSVQTADKFIQRNNIVAVIFRVMRGDQRKAEFAILCEIDRRDLRQQPFQSERLFLSNPASNR